MNADLCWDKVFSDIFAGVCTSKHNRIAVSVRTIFFNLISECVYRDKFFFTNASQFVPPMSEVYHYPYLCVGWFGLLVTSMNLIPVGQLDGGHVIYSMFGEKKHEAIASISMILLLFLGLMGILDSFLDIGITIGWIGWLLWSLILFFLIKVKHPPVNQFVELDFKRKILGYLAILIFILSFSPTPFTITL